MVSATPLKKLAISGALWTLVGYGVSQSLRFGSNLILTRLLVPEFFGLMALINTFVLGLKLFSDVGIVPSIVQNKRGDEPEFLNTAWTLQVIRGFALWIICCIIAYPAAQFYEEPRLLWLLPITGATTIIAGFNSTATATLRRHIALGKTVQTDTLVQAASLIIMIIWAWFSPTIWALVGGSIVGALLKLLQTFFLIPGYSNRFAWDRSAVDELFKFGRWIFISTALTFMATQSDRLILGKLISVEMLGIYTIAYTLSDIPRQVIIGLGGNLIFPLVARSAEQPRSELRKKILKNRLLLLLGAAVLLSILVSFGDLLISMLYDKRYMQATWMAPILSLGLWHTLLYSTMYPCLLGIGQPHYEAAGNFSRFIVLFAGVPLAFSFMGTPGAIIVIAISDLPMYGIIMYGLQREKLGCLRQDAMGTLLFFGLVTALFAGRALLGFDLPFNEFLSSHGLDISRLFHFA